MQLGGHGAWPHKMKAPHLYCPYLQCLFINSNVYLGSESAFKGTMLARMPFVFTFRFDGSVVYLVDVPVW